MTWSAATPSGWQSVPLRALLAERDERDRADREVLSVYRDLGVVPKEGRADNFNKTPEDLSNYKAVYRGDMVINKMKAWQGSMALSQFDGIVSGDYLVCRVVGRVHPRFLHFALRAKNYVAEIASLSTGIRPGQWRLYWDDLKAVRIALPPMGDQVATAEVLDFETARIDGLVARRGRLLELLSERRNGMLRGAFEETNSGRERVPWMPRISDNWPVLPLRWVSECLDGRRVPLNAEQRSAMRGKFPYWGANGIVDQVDDYLFDEELVLLGEDGAPFFAPGKDVAFHVTGRIWVNNHIHVLRPRGIRPLYLSHYLNLVDYAAFITGTTRDKLTQEQMGRIPVPVPPEEEQIRIEQGIDRKLSRIDHLTTKIRAQIQLLREHRQALITAAVTGLLGISGEAA